MTSDRRALRSSSRRHGFALLAVLWTMAGLSALALVVQLTAREAVQGVTRRMELARGQWRAEDCLSRTRHAIDAALSGERESRGPSSVAWRTLPAIVESSPVSRPCAGATSLVAAGSVVDINEAAAEELRRLLRANTRVGPGPLDSLVDAILDWRDVDDLPRPHGAARSWYEEQGRHPPRNGPFADVRELLRVRGMEAVPDPHALFGTEPGRLALAVAPLPVLASLPGMTEDALIRLDELRTRGALPTDLAVFTGLVPPAARDSLHASFAELARLATIEPEAWILTIHGRDAPVAATATIEVRLVRAGVRAAVVRRREWP